jgi:hypothetical protein
MRVRLAIPTMSGCAMRAYFEISQNRFWQSIGCSRRPNNPGNVNPRRLNSVSWCSVIQKMVSSELRPRPLAFESLEPATTHLKLSRRACRHLRSSGCRCREGGVSDRHNRALWPGHSFNPGFEFLRERLDYARTEPSFWLGKDAVRLTNSIVGN